ncbi:hypothetical protein Aeqsu_2113 [Aequorivita sublithincola DSM 14238]|uniref:BNR/Asp-box repeat protein n=1 Tax=Aequorivita sublithincola (strain DSM 14238 / LMG 21431 / ACAM 643 / 9-3) TaxID=746697 RepID=I3YX57_AEQSU|nr:hypothetical protein [Aequorivita sublithincola]AFL81575.1 hypothetical protein Aeqsu_2113 [Aequorivita sublithincola DSM 14238]
MTFLKLIFTIFLSVVILVSCKTETKKKAITSEIETTAETVTLLENPTSGNSALPRLFGTENQLFMSWVETKDSISVLYFSTFEEGKWTKPYEVNSGSDWFINWADFPAIAENNGNIIITYLQKSANGKYTYDAKINLFSAETQTWKKNILLHNDGTASEHGFVSIVPQGKSSFYAIWLDGRNTKAEAGGHGNHGAGAMSLRGRLVHADGTMQPDLELDNRVCDCCQTAMTSIENAPLLVYRNRTGSEVRDISRIGLFDDSFSESQPIFNDNWEIPGCPVNGPSIASYKNNAVVAWFTAVNDNPKVQLAFSKDKGKTFAAPIQVNTYKTLGRVDVVMISENTAIVSWMENLGEDTLIQVMRISADGTEGFPVTISKTSFERASGFPQLEIAGNTLYAAWTMVDGKKKSIETASISIPNL